MRATRSAGVIDSSTTRKAMLTDSSRVTRSAGSAVVPPGRPLIHSAGSGGAAGGGGGGPPRPPADPLGGLGERFGDPFAHVGLSPGPRRAEQVEADAAG